jgi:anti-sigma factor RsiW
MSALRAAGWLLLSAVIGAASSWTFVEWYSASTAAADASKLARRAAVAHAVYAPEVRHPVEVTADEEAHLVAWLSKRLQTEVGVPKLAVEGFAFVGGRLLPGEPGMPLPAAQLMYQNANGRRITLYVRNAGPHEHPNLRYVRESSVWVVHWVDGALAYALASGDIGRDELRRLAEAVQRQRTR